MNRARRKSQLEFFLRLRYQLHAQAGRETDDLTRDNSLWSSEKVEQALHSFGQDYAGFLECIREQAQRL